MHYKDATNHVQRPLQGESDDIHSTYSEDDDDLATATAAKHRRSSFSDQNVGPAGGGAGVVGGGAGSPIGVCGNYSCDQCDKTFSKQSSLARHRYEHSGVCI